MRRSTLALVLVLFALGAPAAPARALPPIKHVFIVLIENKNYSESFGPDSPAPYLSTRLPAMGAQLANYYATGHLSLDNYISLVSGQAPNPQTQADCLLFTQFMPAVPAPGGQVRGQGCVYPATVKTIADQLESKGLSWRGYMEDMANGPPDQAKSCRHPAIGTRDPTQSARKGDQYAARHNPFVYFHSVIDRPACARYDLDYRQLASDLRRPETTPSYAFISPNLCNDAHDAPCVDGQPGGLTSANAWLSREIPKLLASPGFRDDGLLIVTYDEAEASPGSSGDASACCGEQPGPNTPNPGGPVQGPGGGRTGAVLVSPFIRPGTFVAEPYNHYSLLRSVEDIFGLSRLGYAGQPDLRAFGSEIFNQVPALHLRVSPRRIRRGRRVTLRVRASRPALVRLAGRCGSQSKRTDLSGAARFTVRPRRSGRCRVSASRAAWRSASASVRVVRARRRR